MEENPEWIRRTSQRIIQGRRLESSTVGHARWSTAADLVRYSRIEAGLPSEADTAAHASAQAESRLANMAEDWQTVSRDLATAAASFEPSRFSMIVCGRPTQVRCCIGFAVPVIAAPQEHVSLSSAGLFMFYSILVKC